MNKHSPPLDWRSQLSVSRARPAAPELRFSPTAWGKLIYLRDLGPTEVGGFAISAADDLLLVEDLQMVRQICTPVSVAFDDDAVADFFDRQIDAGQRPEQFSRIWVHTHPGDSPHPSGTDEGTFALVFGQMQWAVMFILAEGGQTYARLRFSVGPGGELIIPVSVDFSRPFAASDAAAWKSEYLTNLIDKDLAEAAARQERFLVDDQPQRVMHARPSGRDDPFWNERFPNDGFVEEEYFNEY